MDAKNGRKPSPLQSDDGSIPVEETFLFRWCRSREVYAAERARIDRERAERRRQLQRAVLRDRAAGLHDADWFGDCRLEVPATPRPVPAPPAEPSPITDFGFVQQLGFCDALADVLLEHWTLFAPIVQHLAKKKLAKKS